MAPAALEALRPKVFPPQVTLRTRSLPFPPPLCRPPAAGRRAIAAGLWPRVLAPEGGDVPFESELPLTPRARAPARLSCSPHANHLLAIGTTPYPERVIVEQYHGYLVSCGALDEEL